MRSATRVMSSAFLALCVLGCGQQTDTSGPPAEPEASNASEFHTSIRWTSYGIPHVKAEDWASLGYGFAYAMVQGFESELYRVPLVVERSVYAWASLVVIVSALLSGLIVRRRIDRLDMIEVLKTRE